MVILFSLVKRTLKKILLQHSVEDSQRYCTVQNGTVRDSKLSRVRSSLVPIKRKFKGNSLGRMEFMLTFVVVSEHHPFCCVIFIFSVVIIVNAVIIIAVIMIVTVVIIFTVNI